MNCPTDIAAVVLDILSAGIIRIRCFAGAKDSKKCFIEADHLHNLPAIVSDYRPERVRYYWDIERPSFIAQVPERERRDLEPLWDRLAELINEHAIPALLESLSQEPSAVAK